MRLPVRLWDALVHLLYPGLCVHCKQNTRHYRRLFCEECKELLTFIDPMERCRICFSSIQAEEAISCLKCAGPPFLYHGLAAVFDHFGPAAVMIRELKYRGRISFAKDAAAFMLIQFLRLNWPIPDAIVPVPQSFSRWLVRGYNQSLLIAQEFALLMKRPVFDVLKKKSGEFSQTGLNRAQRNQLHNGSFSWKKKADFSDKTLLVVDDVMTTSTTLRHCGTLLQESFPKRLYGMTLCIS